MEDSVVGEDTEGGEGMAVGVRVQKTTEGLRRNDRRRHRLFARGRRLRSTTQAGAAKNLRVAA